MENKPSRPQITQEEKEEWDKAIAKQQEIANNPRPQREAEEFAKEISRLSSLEWFRQFTI